MTTPRHDPSRDGSELERRSDDATPVGSLFSVLDELVTACEVAFIGGTDHDWPDDDDVASPPSGITFGMIRRARAAIEDLEDARG